MRQSRRRARRLRPSSLVTLLFVAAFFGLGYYAFSPTGAATASGELVAAQSFAMCGRPPHANCVIDGDTFYLGNQSVRIADIDTPEVGSPQCAYEAALGAQATDRLHQLLNAGPFVVAGWGSRDTDQYGRLLRTVSRDGRSLGAILVEEGLARPWTGSRQPWC